MKKFLAILLFTSFCGPKLFAACTAPTNLIVETTPGTSSALVSWKSSIVGLTLSTYEVHYRISPAGAWTIVGSTAKSTTISGLSSTNTYEIKVRTMCKISSGGIPITTPSSFSPSRFFKILPVPVVPNLNPVLCYISKTSFNCSGLIGTMTRNSGQEPTGYFPGTTNTLTYLCGEEFPSMNLSVTTYVNPDLFCKARLVVWADYNNNGVFETSDIVYISPASYSGNTTINIPSFGLPLSAQFLRIRIGLRPGNTNPSGTGVANFGEYEDIPLKILGAVCGTSARAAVSETTLQTSSSKLSIFPNPASDKITIQLNETEEDEIVHLKIQDINGKEISSQEINSMNKELAKGISVKNWQKGIYIATTYSKKGVVDRARFIVQ